MVPCFAHRRPRDCRLALAARAGAAFVRAEAASGWPDIVYQMYISRYHCMFQCTKYYISRHLSISQGPRQISKMIVLICRGSGTRGRHGRHHGAEDRGAEHGQASDIVCICQCTIVFISAYTSMMHCHASISRVYCKICLDINYVSTSASPPCGAPPGASPSLLASSCPSPACPSPPCPPPRGAPPGASPPLSSW